MIGGKPSIAPANYNLCWLVYWEDDQRIAATDACFAFICTEAIMLHPPLHRDALIAGMPMSSCGRHSHSQADSRMRHLPEGRSILDIKGQS